MRVLVVEDERKIVAFIKRGLEGNAYAVDVAYDGQAGRERAQNSAYDFIILDVTLPGMDGIALCRRLRGGGHPAHILMLTATGNKKERPASLDAGADDCLAKPFAIRELLDRLRALGRRGDEERTTQLTIGDLTLDLITHTARRQHRTIDLTAKEYALLEMFMRHPNQVLKRTVIVEHAWNYDFHSQSNIVDVYIRYLRRKIDDPFDVRLIQTVRGIGYRLVEPAHA